MKRRFRYSTILRYYLKWTAKEMKENKIINGKDYIKANEFMFYLENIMEN